MKRLLCSALAFLLASIASYARENPELQAKGRAIIERGIKVGNLAAPDVPPFVLAGTSSWRGKQESFTLYWSAPKFRVEASPAITGEYVTWDGEKLWERNTSGFRFDRLVVDYARGLRTSLEEERVVRVREKQEKGALSQCVTTSSARVRERESCFDSKTGALVSMRFVDDMPNPIGGPRSRELPRFYETVVNYQKFGEFHGVLYPHVVEIKSDGVVRGHRLILSIRDLDETDPSFFSPASGTTPWDWCWDMTGPSMEFDMFVPDDPASSIGQTSVRLVVSETGHVVAGFVLQEQKTGDGKKLLEHYAKKIFAPAECHHKPIQATFVMTIGLKN